MPSYYECSVCGHKSQNRMGECPQCGSLDTFLEQEGTFDPEAASVETTEEGSATGP